MKNNKCFGGRIKARKFFNHLLEKVGNIENSLGQVDLRILYDDDVFGARIVAYSGKPTQWLLCQYKTSPYNSITFDNVTHNSDYFQKVVKMQLTIFI